MAKDPSVLFYCNDFLTGTAHFSREEKGLFIELLCFQQQRGPLSLDFIRRVSGIDFDRLWPVVKEKFQTDPAGNFFNERMRQECQKRKRFSESRRNNLKGDKNHMDPPHETPICDPHMNSHMENENENENRNEKEIKGGVGEKTGNFIFVDDQKIFEDELSEWFNKNFQIQKPNWQRLFPRANIDEALKQFMLRRAFETFKDTNHFKNSFAIILKEIDKNYGKGTNGFKDGNQKPRPRGTGPGAF